MCDHNRQLFSNQEQLVMDAYGWRCVLCGFQCANSLHEEPPRSLNPNWSDEPWTQFPLCPAHHESVQGMDREEAKELLLSHEHIFAPGAIERIIEQYANRDTE